MALEDLTHDQLDDYADTHDVGDDYPRSGTKAEKVSALRDAGVPEPADPDAPQATADPAPHQDAVNEGRTGLDPRLAEARDAAREVERPTREAQDAARETPEQSPVVDPDGQFAAARQAALEAEGVERDTRDGLPEA